MEKLQRRAICSGNREEMINWNNFPQYFLVGNIITASKAQLIRETWIAI
ncbi:hypothetical protein SAMN04488057_104407 [Cyclobacterium lianum]|uniref:Uncharacterized protein n=1 Tax=Cyclobacterium lianum TaxID=388280 RepID=A0A1M7MNT7_9BACT|nr:hypothetical protein SAMN04488057_104407 [Cyclobacterium lianum]